MKVLIVNRKYDCKKLNNFILDSFPNLNKNTLYKALRKKDVRVNKEKVTLKTGTSYKIKASMLKVAKHKKLMPTTHAPKIRYLSSNKKIATVSKKGKITAKKKGSCKVYAIAVNGKSKIVKVIVK